MEDLLLWMKTNPAGEWFYTALMSMAPIVELRGGIPFGVSLGLPVWQAFIAAVIGNMIPVPFIVIFIRRIFGWMRTHSPRLSRLVERLERKAHLKGQLVTKYRYLGLMILVAIPLPGTGAWTGALAAAFLNMRLLNTLPAIFAGVVIAGLLISMLTFGVASFF